MKKVLTVLGARPQFIKASVVSAEIVRRNDITEVVTHTGQHFDSNMSDIFFKELGIPVPKYQLGISGGSHGEMTGRMLIHIEHVIKVECPDIVLVYGDTNSTLAGALAACKLNVPVAHVEAGLRSFNMRMPEEINRILTDRISSWLFTPTDIATQHLNREGIPKDRIVQAGDVMYDVALFYGARVNQESGRLNELSLNPKQFILATIHRAENTDDLVRLHTIVKSLIKISKEILPVVWPVHPRTRQTLSEQGWLTILEKAVKLIDPVGYLAMVQLEKHAALIATDSGGVQKEAFFYGVPCVTLRDETEWVELVTSGWNHLVSPISVEVIFGAISRALSAKPARIEPYGNGNTAVAIVDELTR
ncbi:UDP-N-acetylglucosamine 2-epimerase (non-hydrolyzing) [Pusillimonas caeni]|uniref:non-hydrolyzing UDP-N-acetylglucosamine 2-epimerase n=1 Tax=Pusillimonas caeni TaxID=1348472 RepID=UPI000E59F461|nr:UDP-N-acetylglucosamine 2-epimerase (non-hydrolyzing) [Pusillimonas caeni]TFL14853.1 UDP-N-acetylglucosamine 2-epimerase (non-hydrolyzing) [Pusillimonas caeni]